MKLIADIRCILKRYTAVTRIHMLQGGNNLAQLVGAIHSQAEYLRVMPLKQQRNGQGRLCRLCLVVHFRHCCARGKARAHELDTFTLYWC
jgi:hypothetical protein